MKPDLLEVFSSLPSRPHAFDRLDVKSEDQEGIRTGMLQVFWIEQNFLPTSSRTDEQAGNATLTSSLIVRDGGKLLHLGVSQPVQSSLDKLTPRFSFQQA